MILVLLCLLQQLTVELNQNEVSIANASTSIEWLKCLIIEIVELLGSNKKEVYDKILDAITISLKDYQSKVQAAVSILGKGANTIISDIKIVLFIMQSNK